MPLKTKYAIKYKFHLQHDYNFPSELTWPLPLPAIRNNNQKTLTRNYTFYQRILKKLLSENVGKKLGTVQGPTSLAGKLQQEP